MTIIQYNPGDDRTYVMEPNGVGGYTRQKGFYLHTHPRSACEGRACCIHSPSVHPLLNAPLVWDESVGVVFRLCMHGDLHTDPDDAAYRRSVGRLPHSHYCDGCCHE